MKIIEISVPEEIITLLGSEEEAKKEVKEAFILDLVRRGKISKGKAAELMGLNLWDLPPFLAQYQIPWFSYSQEDLDRDLTVLKSSGKNKELPGESGM